MGGGVLVFGQVEDKGGGLIQGAGLDVEPLLFGVGVAKSLSYVFIIDKRATIPAELFPVVGAVQ